MPKNTLATPPTGSRKEAVQMQQWKRVLAYEKKVRSPITSILSLLIRCLFLLIILKNPQGLDPAALRDRVVFAYNQALLVLYHFPEIWFDLARDEKRLVEGA